MPEQSTSKKFHSKAALNFYQQAWESEGKFRSPVAKKRSPSNSCRHQPRGPKLAACYLCGNMYSLHSFPIHLPQCYAKKLVAWERSETSTRGSPPKHPEDVVSLLGIDVSPRSLQMFNEQQLEMWNGGRKIQYQSCRKRSASRERCTRSPVNRISPSRVPCMSPSDPPKGATYPQNQNQRPTLIPPFRSPETQVVPFVQLGTAAPHPPSPTFAFGTSAPGAESICCSSLSAVSSSPTPSGSLLRQFAISDMQQKLYTIVESRVATPIAELTTKPAEVVEIRSESAEVSTTNYEACEFRTCHEVPMFSSLPSSAFGHSNPTPPSSARPTPVPLELNFPAPDPPSTPVKMENSTQGEAPSSPYSETLRSILHGVNSLAKQIKQRGPRSEYEMGPTTAIASASLPHECNRAPIIPTPYYSSPTNVPQNPYKRQPSPVGRQEPAQIQYHRPERFPVAPQDRFPPAERPGVSPTPSVASTCRPCHSFTPIYPPSAFNPMTLPSAAPPAPAWGVPHPGPSPTSASVLNTPTPTLAYGEMHALTSQNGGQRTFGPMVPSTAGFQPTPYVHPTEHRVHLPFSLPDNYAVAENQIAASYSNSLCSSSPRQSPAGSLLEERHDTLTEAPQSRPTSRPPSGSPKRHSPPPRPGACKVPPSPSIVPVKSTIPEKRPLVLYCCSGRESNASEATTPRASPLNHQ